MPRKVHCLLALALLLTLAEGAAAQVRAGKTSLPANRKWVKFQVILGQIRVLEENYGQNMSASASNPLTGEREVFSINVTGPAPTVRYEFASDDQHLIVDFLSSGRISIVREPREDHRVVPLMFTQASDGKVMLALGMGKDRREITAENFWHLVLLEPAASREQLIPILESLRPGWQLASTARQLETQLFVTSSTARIPDRQRMERLLAELSSNEFSRRQAAESELRKLGFAAASFLATLDSQSLDYEQQQRVSNILQRLQVDTDDTPQRIAAVMIDNRLVWLTMLGHPDVARRTQAATHLSKLLKRPIEFDPAGDEAARKDQIQRLKLGLTSK